jgi:hypothetical protein
MNGFDVIVLLAVLWSAMDYHNNEWRGTKSLSKKLWSIGTGLISQASQLKEKEEKNKEE